MVFVSQAIILWQEENLSRVINPDGVGKERKRLTRAVVLALRELMLQPEPNDKSKDLAAFISIALMEIFDTVDQSVAAWEKRGYWVKADRFRMEWNWTQKTGEAMRAAVLEGNWGRVAENAAITAQKLMSTQVPVRHRLGTPWVGSWKRLIEE